MRKHDKPLVWMHGEIKSPPFSTPARIEAGYLFRLLQIGEKLSLPHSRPMPSIGTNCHELRINDENSTWRIIYRIDNDAIVILEVFNKKSQQTPKKVIDVCKKRIKEYDNE
ncbi:MAG: type II toxin-antitoxin system RelE/ParE family toxin [Melioribacteraceae bacterium]|nr:type II toxin-antitoxin system RelE/ParE family toxin [Saprospiraceae bacterium]MCF8356037.1 type II toxin-antitoxin system RelE/ParE family toxin [Melioribacteraceae bacterium]MCF8395528.1 type II toxin-antitoxin system RelE/ParE family toxin [Melioribacteraceae bacterium]